MRYQSQVRQIRARWLIEISLLDTLVRLREKEVKFELKFPSILFLYFFDLAIVAYIPSHHIFALVLRVEDFLLENCSIGVELCLQTFGELPLVRD